MGATKENTGLFDCLKQAMEANQLQVLQTQ